MAITNNITNNNLSGSLPIQTETPMSSEKSIDQIARRIISAGQTDDALGNLLAERTKLLTHVPVNGIRDTALFVNMKQIGLPPTPLCPYYNKMRFPTVSTYHVIGANIAVFTLCQEAQKYIPQHVLAAAGDLNGKQVDLFCTVIDGRFAIGNQNRNNHPLNLCTHPWTHPYIQCGENVACDVQMGIFPEIGFAQRNNDLAAIAVNRLSPMNVHTHDDRYSPDNAHFNLVPGSPLGVAWSVLQKDNRVAITKMLVIFDYDNPISQRLLNSIRDCNNLDTHMSRLSSVQIGIDQIFAPLLEQLENNDQQATATFLTLPPTFQHGIFKQVYLLKDSPQGIHSDFGRASYLSDMSLKSEYHCTKEEQIQAIEVFKLYLTHLLIESQNDLLCKSQSLIKPASTLRMMDCAELINNQQLREAGELFANFSQDEKMAVYLALWEVRKCPQDGQLQATDSNRAAVGRVWGEQNWLRITWDARRDRDALRDALLLAASRQEETVNPIPVQQQPIPVINNTLGEIAVTCDVGFGNTLGIRTEPNWNENIPFRYENGQWRGAIPQARAFKFVITKGNGDVKWENGSNRVFGDLSQAQSQINARRIQF